MVPLALKENALRLPNAETDKVTDVVKHSRRDQDQTIEAIQQSAVSRDELGGVLQTQIAFYRGEHQVPELAYYADDYPKTN
jgi:hypothetical protein